MGAKFSQEITSFVKREIADRELTLRARLQDSPDNSRLLNRLGVLYARYGLTVDATELFEQAIARDEYAPALANLGNIEYLNKNLLPAATFYERAVAEDPEYDAAVLGLARVNHELENFGTARTYYNSLARLNPALALEYDYLSLRGEEAARASDAAGLGGKVHWGEE